MLNQQTPDRSETARPPSLPGEPLPPLIGTYASDTRSGALAPSAEPPGSQRPTDGDRLDQMERTIRELAAERTAMSQLVGELRRELLVRNEAAGRYRGGFDDRLGLADQTADRLLDLERSVEAKFGDLARGWAALGERLLALEHQVASSRGEVALPADLMSRLQAMDDAGRSINTMADLLAGLEHRLSAASPNAAAVDLAPVVERLAGLEARLDTGTVGREQKLAALDDRLRGIETLVADVKTRVAGAAGPGNGGDVGSAVNDRITAVDKALQGFEQRIAERDAARAKDLLTINANQETLQASLQSLLTSIGKRAEQRGRFRTWLMGTDDWYGASWEPPKPKPALPASPAVGNSKVASPAPPHPAPSSSRTA